MSVLRLGHVKLRVLDMAEALDHYTSVMGMIVQHRDLSGDVYLKCWDEWDKYSVILREADTAGLDHLAFKVSSDSELDRLAEAITSFGLDVAEVAPGGLPFCGRALKTALPSEHVTYLYAEKETVGKAVGILNPEPWPDGLEGIGVHWLDHAMLVCEVNPEKGINRVADNVKFFREVLDFGLSEQILPPGGGPILAAWMFCTTTPHDIAMGPGDGPGLHHIAFYLDDWSSILRAADILGKRKVRVDITPQRHGITRGPTTYFFDPSGNRNECFAGLGYLTQKDMPTITWEADNIWRGIFFHSGYVNAPFLEVHT